MEPTRIAELRDALAGLVRRPEGAPPVEACLDRIERLGAEWGAAAPAVLRHYLANRSYQKALLFLEDREAENARGACR